MVEYTTPYSEDLDEGTYIVEVPTLLFNQPVGPGGTGTYGFIGWSDGEKSPARPPAQRVITLTDDITTEAQYDEIPLPSPEKGMLVVAANFVVPIIIDGIQETTTATLELDPGEYLVTVPESAEIQGVDGLYIVDFVSWKDGTLEMSRLVAVIANQSTVIEAVYEKYVEPVPPVPPEEPTRMFPQVWGFIERIRQRIQERREQREQREPILFKEQP